MQPLKKYLANLVETSTIGILEAREQADVSAADASLVVIVDKWLSDTPADTRAATLAVCLCVSFSIATVRRISANSNASSTREHVSALLVRTAALSDQRLQPCDQTSRLGNLARQGVTELFLRRTAYSLFCLLYVLRISTTLHSKRAQYNAS